MEQAMDQTAPALLRLRGHKPADCIVYRYAIIINGSGEERFWTDVEQTYEMLVTTYGLPPSDIYVLNYLGTNPDHENPGGMIDGGTAYGTVEDVFRQLADLVDADDQVYIWITGHGVGYEGTADRGQQYLGYLSGRASVDPGDEQDYPESDFKLRSLFTGGDWACNHGLNVWKVNARYGTEPATLYRNMFVSSLDGVYIETLNLNVYDEDTLIERLIDYCLGDTNRDGRINPTAGEVFDYDGDGMWAFDPVTEQFDEDEWGEVDGLEDDHNAINSLLTVDAYPICLFDYDHQGRLCIDLDYAGGTPEIDGRDEDGQGLFDWLDANHDGDTDDMISIDEAICLAFDNLYDDELAQLIDGIQAGRVVVTALPCFSGGLIEDLSGHGRITCTATTEEAVSWGNHFLRTMAGALGGSTDPAYQLDADSNGYISICEAFNYTAWSDPYDETPQYDDNGDGISHAYPLPSGGDGSFGSYTYICDTCSTYVCPGSPCSQTLILAQNRPNPFIDETEIYYWLPADTHVNLCVYDVEGRKVAELVSTSQPAGPHWITWRGHGQDGIQLVSGVYFYRLEIGGDRRISRKMLLLR
jgi:hypothetical protein